MHAEQAGPARQPRHARPHGPRVARVHPDPPVPPLLTQLRVVPHGDYIAAVFNPASKWKIKDHEQPESPFREPSIYDDALMERFAGRRFAPLEPAFLEHEGAELVLIGGRSDAV